MATDTARQTATRGSRTQTQGSRGLTRGSRTGSIGAQTTGTNKPFSLFDAVKATQKQAADENEGVKADDIWNKFVSDDQNVVRAPTADTHVSEIPEEDSQGEEDEEEGDEDDEEEEEEEESSEDDRTIYSDYYLPPEYIREVGTPGPRAEITDSHEACGCFPNRSHKFIGSMLYDKVQCIHTGITGHTQPGVFKFNPYWNENMEQPRRLRKRDMKISKSKWVFGYPRPRFELVSESEGEDDYGDDPDDEEGSSGYGDGGSPESMTTTLAKSSFFSKYGGFFGKRKPPPKVKKFNGSDEDSDEDYGEEDEDYIPFQLPQIGYPQTPSLPPSSRASRQSEYTDSVPELPPLSRTMSQATRRTGVTQKTGRTQFTLPTQRDAKTAKSGKTVKTEKTKGKSTKKAGSVNSGYDGDGRRTAESRQSLPTGPVISTARNFQGKFFDPVTKRVMLYDIATAADKRLPEGNLEPLYKPKPETDRKKDGDGSKPGSSQSKASHHSVPKAAVLGAVFIGNLLSKNKRNKDVVIEAGYEGDQE